MPIGMRNLLEKKPSDKKVEVDKVSKILNRKNTGVYSKVASLQCDVFRLCSLHVQEKQKMIESDNDEEEEDEQDDADLMVVKRRDHDLDEEEHGIIFTFHIFPTILQYLIS